MTFEDVLLRFVSGGTKKYVSIDLLASLTRPPMRGYTCVAGATTTNGYLQWSETRRCLSIGEQEWTAASLIQQGDFCGENNPLSN